MIPAALEVNNTLNYTYEIAADREHQVSCSKGGPHAIAAPIESLALVQNTASRGASAMANAGASRSPESILTVPAAGADGVVCAYDVLHSYQPSRTYSAAPSGSPVPRPLLSPF